MLPHLGHGRSSGEVGEKGTALVTLQETQCPKGLPLFSGFADVLGQKV